MVAVVVTTPPMGGWRQHPASVRSKHESKFIESNETSMSRSLVSEVEQNSPGRTWGRSFNSLQQRLSKLSNDRSKPPSVDSWYGRVAISRGVSDSADSQSPDSKITPKFLEVPMTPPISKKKKSKKPRSPKQRSGKQRVELTPPNSPLLWGDYGLTHSPVAYQELQVATGEPYCPERTPEGGVKRKNRSNNDSFEVDEQGTWDELLGFTHSEDCSRDDTAPRRSLILELTSDIHGSAVRQTSLLDAPPLNTPNEESFLARFHATYPQRNEASDGREKELNDVSRIVVVDEHKIIYGDPMEADDQLNEKSSTSRHRLLRFADEQGLPIASIHVVGDEHDPYATSRIVVLFLDPVAKKFEFLQGEFSHVSGATVSDLLRQLPDFAAYKIFSEKEYVSIYGTKGGPRQFGLNDRLQELDLCKREVVVAVTKGSVGEHLVKVAAPLLSNKKIMRGIRKASRIGRGLKYIQSTREMEQEMAEATSTGGMVVSPIPDDNLDQAELPLGNLSYPAPTVLVYGDTHQEQIPDLINFPDFHDAINMDHDCYRETNDEPRRMMKYLHAALWATIGIAYMANSS